MKVVHLKGKKKGEEEMLSDLRHAAKEYEEEGELEKAAQTYEKIIRKITNDSAIFDRLMIVYRKQQEYAKELRIINKALVSFTKIHGPKTADKKVTTLSKKLMRITGLSDNNGNSLYEGGPLGKWRRRKIWVEKRLSR